MIDFNDNTCNTLRPRRGRWSSWVKQNPVLKKGEFVIVFPEEDENGFMPMEKGRIKVGDGIRHFIDLPYFNYMYMQYYIEDWKFIEKGRGDKSLGCSPNYLTINDDLFNKYTASMDNSVNEEMYHRYMVAKNKEIEELKAEIERLKSDSKDNNIYDEDTIVW